MAGPTPSREPTGRACRNEPMAAASWPVTLIQPGGVTAAVMPAGIRLGAAASVV